LPHNAPSGSPGVPRSHLHPAKKPRPAKPRATKPPAASTPQPTPEQSASISLGAASTCSALSKQLVELTIEHDEVCEQCHENSLAIERLKLDMADAPRGHMQPIRDQIKRVKNEGYSLGWKLLWLTAKIEKTREESQGMERSGG
jgi:hypothetical protein